MKYLLINYNNDSKLKISATKRLIIWFAALFIPKANPDFEGKINEVSEWLLEFQDEGSTPEREIGLSKTSEVVMKMPYKKNCGYWIDNRLTFQDFTERFKTQPVTKEFFEDTWEKYLL